MDNPLDFESILALKSLMDLGVKNDGLKLDKEAKNGGITDILSAAIPFIDVNMQRTIFIAIKALEIMDYISIPNNQLTALNISSTDKATKRKEFLSAVAPYLSESERNNLNTIIRVLEIKKIMG